MTLRTRARTWAVLPALGLLTWSAAGCRYEVPAPEAAAPVKPTTAPTPSATAEVQRPRMISIGAQEIPASGFEPTAPPPATVSTPATIPSLPGLNANDAGPDRQAALPDSPSADKPGGPPPAVVDANTPTPPLSPVSIESAEQEVRGAGKAIDADVRRTARTLEKSLDAAARPVVAPAAAQAPVRPKSALPDVPGIGQVAETIKAEAGRTGDEVAGDVKQEIGRMAERVKTKGLTEARRAAPGSLKTIQQQGKDAVAKGVKRAEEELSKEIGQAIPGR